MSDPTEVVPPEIWDIITRYYPKRCLCVCKILNEISFSNLIYDTSINPNSIHIANLIAVKCMYPDIYAIKIHSIKLFKFLVTHPRYKRTEEIFMYILRNNYWEYLDVLMEYGKVFTHKYIIIKSYLGEFINFECRDFFYRFLEDNRNTVDILQYALHIALDRNNTEYVGALWRLLHSKYMIGDLSVHTLNTLVKYSYNNYVKEYLDTNTHFKLHGSDLINITIKDFLPSDNPLLADMLLEYLKQCDNLNINTIILSLLSKNYIGQILSLLQLPKYKKMLHPKIIHNLLVHSFNLCHIEVLQHFDIHNISKFSITYLRRIKDYDTTKNILKKLLTYNLCDFSYDNYKLAKRVVNLQDIDLIILLYKLPYLDHSFCGSYSLITSVKNGNLDIIKFLLDKTQIQIKRCQYILTYCYIQEYHYIINYLVGLRSFSHTVKDIKFRTTSLYCLLRQNINCEQFYDVKDTFIQQYNIHSLIRFLLLHNYHIPEWLFHQITHENIVRYIRENFNIHTLKSYINHMNDEEKYSFLFLVAKYGDMDLLIMLLQIPNNHKQHHLYICLLNSFLHPKIFKYILNVIDSSLIDEKLLETIVIVSNYDKRSYESVDVLLHHPNINPTFNNYWICRYIIYNGYYDKKEKLLNLMRQHPQLRNEINNFYHKQPSIIESIGWNKH